jgi:hypothetical protein
MQCYSLICPDVMYSVLCVMLSCVVLFVCWDVTWAVMYTGVCYIVVNCAVWAELCCIFLDELCYAVLFSDLPWCDVPCFVCNAVLCGVWLLRCNMNSDVHCCVLHSGELCWLSWTVVPFFRWAALCSAILWCVVIWCTVFCVWSCIVCCLIAEM